MDKPDKGKVVKDADDRGDGARVKTFGPGNKRAELEGLWDMAPKEVVGLPIDRVMTNCYCKESGDKKVDIVDEMITHGPPFMNSSTSKRIL